MNRHEESRRIPSSSASLGWLGHSRLETTPSGRTHSWRLSSSPELDIAPTLRHRAGMPAGVRWEFETDATSLLLRIEVVPDPSGEGCSPLDVEVDGVVTDRIRLADGEQDIRVDLVGRHGRTDTTRLVRLWHPQFGTVHWGPVDLVGPTAPGIRPAARRRPRWVAYGSSITQCRSADGPTSTWPARVARRNGWDLDCLGFGSECHLDGAVAREIRSRAADVISLCVGINIYGAASLSRRTIGPQLAGFLATVREGHPDAPLVVMTPIPSPERESRANAVGLTLAQVREEVRTAAHAFRDARGDRSLHVVDGAGLLDPAEAAVVLADGLHPDDGGYALLAERLAPMLRAHAETSGTPAAP